MYVDCVLCRVNLRNYVEYRMAQKLRFIYFKVFVNVFTSGCVMDTVEFLYLKIAINVNCDCDELLN